MADYTNLKINEDKHAETLEWLRENKPDGMSWGGWLAEVVEKARACDEWSEENV
jgi:hypothetical protein